MSEELSGFKVWKPLPNGLYRAEEDSEHPDWPTAIDIDDDRMEVSNASFRLRNEYRLCHLVDDASLDDAAGVPSAEALNRISRLVNWRIANHGITIADLEVRAWLESQIGANDERASA